MNASTKNNNVSAENKNYLKMSDNTLTVEQFTKLFPWEEPHPQRKPVELLLSYQLNVSPETLWPYIVDTSSFNELAGFPPMQFHEEDGKLFGSANYSGIQMNWLEREWEWEYARLVKNIREFSKGIGTYLRGIYYLVPTENGTQLYVYFGWIPKGWISRQLITYSLKAMNKSFNEGIKNLHQRLLNGKPLPILKNKINLDEFSINNLITIEKQIDEMVMNPSLTRKVIEFVRESSDFELEKIRVKALAREWGVDTKELLTLFLHATQKGLFVLTWDSVCPHCRISREDSLSLGDIPQALYCEVCEIDFDPTELNALEITFHIHPSIRKVEKTVFCSAEPAKKSHIKFQIKLAPKETRTIESALTQGLYRMREKGSKQYAFLDVSSHEKNHIVWQAGAHEKYYKTSNFPVIEFKNPSQKVATYVIEEYEQDNETLTPGDLFNLQTFRNLFSEEAIASGMKIDIGKQTILFTDIVGSTKFYYEQGDANAFGEVKKHFVKVYELVEKHNGAVVKTIGDAVMAAFSNELDGFKCGLELQKVFTNTKENNPIRIRVSIHAGNCLAVKLNNNIDYFGNTINLAAKLQNMTDEGEIVCSNEVFSNDNIKKWANANKLEANPIAFELIAGNPAISAHKLTKAVIENIIL